jgi:type II secretory pathway component PulF
MGRMKELAIDIEEVEVLVSQGLPLNKAIELIAEQSQFEESHLWWGWNSKHSAREAE